jgi:hypothetical protein
MKQTTSSRVICMTLLCVAAVAGCDQTQRTTRAPQPPNAAASGSSAIKASAPSGSPVSQVDPYDQGADGYNSGPQSSAATGTRGRLYRAVRCLDATVKPL